jgi:hypothetical protein
MKHETVLTDWDKQEIHNQTGAGHGMICLVEDFILTKQAEKAQPVAYRIKTFGSVHKFVVRADVAEEHEYKLGEIHGPDKVTVDALYAHPPTSTALLEAAEAISRSAELGQSVINGFLLIDLRAAIEAHKKGQS